MARAFCRELLRNITKKTNEISEVS